MFSLSPTTRIFVALEPVDLRLGFNGLHGLVQNRLGGDPLSGHLYLFTNRRRNRLKALYWDGSGLILCTKRLEKGTFGWPQLTEAGGASASLSQEEMALLVSGLELRSRPNWYRKQIDQNMQSD
jgi:transposase